MIDFNNALPPSSTPPNLEVGRSRANALSEQKVPEDIRRVVENVVQQPCRKSLTAARPLPQTPDGPVKPNRPPPPIPSAPAPIPSAPAPIPSAPAPIPSAPANGNQSDLPAGPAMPKRPPPPIPSAPAPIPSAPANGNEGGGFAELSSSTSTTHSTSSSTSSVSLGSSTKTAAKTTAAILRSAFAAAKTTSTKFKETVIGHFKSPLDKGVPQSAPIIKSVAKEPIVPEEVAFGEPDGKALELIDTLIDRIKGENGHAQEGLFRLSGTDAEMKAAITKIKKGEEFDKVAENLVDANTTASTIKAYLKGLSPRILENVKSSDISDIFEGLKTEKNQKGWDQLTPLNQEEEEKLKEDLKKAVETLTQDQRSILKSILGLCKEITANENTTKMGAANLGIVLGPNLFPEVNDPRVIVAQTAKQSKVVQTLIEIYNRGELTLE